MPPRPRTDANQEAEARYRRKFKQVLIRFTEAEMKLIDEALDEGESAPTFIKEQGLKAAKRIATRK